MTHIDIEALKNIAREAGDYIRGSDERHHTDKSNTKDFVTVADIKSQDMIRSRLRGLYADSVILSEEDDEPTRARMYEPDFTGFVLDPIDGTYNFKRDMKESGISIGYIESGKPVAGVIYDPYKDEMFEAQSGQGALLNGTTIAVSGRDAIVGSSIATSNSYSDTAMLANLNRHIAIYNSSGTMPWTSCPGSGVLIMAWVACGRIDAYHHNGLKPWDSAAAFLLVSEAGGSVRTLDGISAGFTSNNVLLGTPQLVGKLAEIFVTLPPELTS